MRKEQLHIAMYPWFAIGHITPFLQLSNHLAQRGHKISFLLPEKARLQLQHINLHPHLITFYPITVPSVPGIPPGTQTASDIHISLTTHLATAMDLTRDQVRSSLQHLKPDFILYDKAHWIPELAAEIGGIKTVCYVVISAASLAIALVPARRVPPLTEAELAEPPPGYPSSQVVFRPHEAQALSFISFEFGSGITFYKRVTTALKNCDAISIRTCRELEGSMCDYLASQYSKPVLLTGPVLDPLIPVAHKTSLDERWAEWLARFNPGSVIYCALGSQLVLDKEQFQQLLLGFELTELPFLAVLKPPVGAATVEDAFPLGFGDRIRDRGAVYGGWIQQPQILDHPSVGCFVSHCGFGSMWESLMSNSQIVLLPHLGDQILNTRLLANELKVGVEIEKDGKSGLFSKEDVCMAIKSAMGGESEVGKLIKKNHSKWRETLTSPEFTSGYIDKFLEDLLKL